MINKRYAEFHYWNDHDETKMRGYVTDGSQHRYPEFEFKKELLESVIAGLKSIYPELLRCKHVN